MPRHSRLLLQNVPLHVVQRGHDRQPVFTQADDYEYYLANLVEAKADLNVRVYGYCLMTNHVHLVLEPGCETTAISKLMKLLAGRQTRYVNKLEKRSGTLWDGRFKASLIDSESYLLACCRYIDLNPVRAAIVSAPGEYEWSSYRSHSATENSTWLDSHSVFTALGQNQIERGAAYRRFVANSISADEMNFIRTAVCRNQLTGHRQFREAIEERTGRRVSVRGPGRPKSSLTGK